MHWLFRLAWEAKAESRCKCLPDGAKFESDGELEDLLRGGWVDQEDQEELRRGREWARESMARAATARKEATATAASERG